jgi:hypothetical protein
MVRVTVEPRQGADFGGRPPPEGRELLSTVHPSVPLPIEEGNSLTRPPRVLLRSIRGYAPTRLAGVRSERDRPFEYVIEFMKRSTKASGHVMEIS